MSELFGLKISEGAIANAFQRLADPLEATRTAIRKALQDAQVIASDETTTRINGVTSLSGMLRMPCRAAIGIGYSSPTGRCCTRLCQGAPKPWPRKSWAHRKPGIARRSGYRTVTPGSRIWRMRIRSDWCMSCAMCSMQLMAAIRSLRRKSATYFAGPFASGDDEMNCARPRWRSIMPGPSGSWTLSSTHPPHILRAAYCRRRLKRRA